ncbi:MAG TPA: SBBP repeat-containing protein [Thermoanaerobaculia bacterium]
MRQTTRKALWLTAGAIGVWMGGAALYAQTGAETAGLELIYSTYLGGTGEELEPSLALDAQGQVYMTAASASPDFPIVGGFDSWYDVEHFPQQVVFAKLGPGGALAYSSRAGAPFINDVSRDIAVGADGSINITGWIDGGDDTEVMVTRFTQLDAGGFDLFDFSGESGDIAEAIALDPQGNLYVAGFSNSFWFPSQQPNMGDAGAFVMKLDPGLGILALHFLPQGAVWPSGLALDAAGNIYLTGWANSQMPTLNAAQPSFGGGQRDTYVWKLDPSGNPVWGTFLGGSLADESTSIAVDPAGNVWVAGWTDSPDFPTRNALQPSSAGGRDAFVTKLSASGSFVFSTFLGGASADEALGIALAERDGAHLTGLTASPDFPLVHPLQACGPGSSPACGGTEAFVATLDSAGTHLILSTFLGGGGDDRGTDIAIGPNGDLFITGLTSSTDFPTRNAYQPALAGSSDFFVTRLRTNPPPDCSAATASPSIIWPPNGKLVPVSITGVTGSGDPITLAITGITQDESWTGKTPDASGIGTSSAQVRASRAGKGDGRVYHLAFEATNPQGASCTGTVAVCVPHDRGRGAACGDGGALFDSTRR